MRACMAFRLTAALVALLLISRAAGAGSGQGTTNQDLSGEDAAAAFSLPAFLHQITDTGGLRPGSNKTACASPSATTATPSPTRSAASSKRPAMTAASAPSSTPISKSSSDGRERTFHASIHSIFGTNTAATHLDNLMLVSSVEAPPTIRLFNLWIEQDLTSRISLRVGQFTAAQEFIVSRNADLFVNSTFGWPTLNTQDLPSGGPNYPEAALGARLQVAFSDQLVLRAAIFDGDPAGSGSNNPVTTDRYGVAYPCAIRLS